MIQVRGGTTGRVSQVAQRYQNEYAIWRTDRRKSASRPRDSF